MEEVTGDLWACHGLVACSDMRDSCNSAKEGPKECRCVGVSESGCPGHKSLKCYFKMNANAANYPLKARDQTA